MDVSFGPEPKELAKNGKVLFLRIVNIDERNSIRHPGHKPDIGKLSDNQELAAPRDPLINLLG